MGPADSRRITRVPRYSGSCPNDSDFAYRTLTSYGPTFQKVPLVIVIRRGIPTTPLLPCDSNGLGSSPVARRYWGNHSYFLFLPLLRCFSSRRWLPDWPMARLQRTGFSHSDIRGSRVACTSPRLFAACHVLHRLWEPRHPPYALSHFERTCTIQKKQDGTRGASLLVRTSLTSLFVSLPLFRVATCH